MTTSENMARRYHMKSGGKHGRYPTAHDRMSSYAGKPDANYNFRMADVAGRRMMPIQYLHPADGHVADENGLVDLGPRCGTPVRMLCKGARVVWSCDMPVLNRLIASSAIAICEGYRQERYKYVLVDPGSTLREVFENWQLHIFTPGTLEASALYLSMRSACRIPGVAIPDARQLDAAFEFQRVLGHYSTPSLRAHIPIPYANEKFIRTEMNARIKRLRQTKWSLDDVEGLSHEEMTMLVPVLENLRESCFDPKEGEFYREPSEKLRKMLWSMDSYRVVGSIYSYAISGTARRDETAQTYVSRLKRFEDLARRGVDEFDIKDTRKVTMAFEYIAFSHLLDNSISRFARYDVCQSARIVLIRTRRFCLSSLSTDAVSAEAPAIHADDAGFLSRLRTQYADLRPKMRKNRKGRSDEVAKRYERVVDGAAFRAQQIARDGKAGRAAIDVLLSAGNGSVPYQQFEVEDDELASDGLPTGRRIIKTWRVWRTEAAWASLRRPNASVRGNGCSVHYRQKHSERLSVAPLPFVFELVDVQCEDGARALLPWFVELGEALAFTSPGHMTVDQRQRRHNLMRKLKLPDYRGSAAGLLNFERDRSTLARIAMSLPVPRRFFPLEEFDHAMMLAAHGLDTAVQTWARPHEIIQQTAYKEDWMREEEDQNDLDPDNDRGFYVYRKVAKDDQTESARTFLECSDALYVSAMQIVRLMVRRWFPAAAIPISKPKTCTWKLSPQPWIFSSRSGAISPTELNYFVRILLAGIADATLHDFRHASAHRANKNRVIMTIIKAGLGQRSESLARYYARLCLEDRRERRKENANQKRIDAARMRERALLLERGAA